MSKDVLDKMTPEDKARDYDRIYRALVEATQEMGRQSCEMEKMRRRLRELKPPKRYVHVTVEARAVIPVDYLWPTETPAKITERMAFKRISDVGGPNGIGVLHFMADNGHLFTVTTDTQVIEEEED